MWTTRVQKKAAQALLAKTKSWARMCQSRVLFFSCIMRAIVPGASGANHIAMADAGMIGVTLNIHTP